MPLPRFTFTNRAAPFLEVGFGTSSAAVWPLWDFARWDDPRSEWHDDEPIWSDVSCDVYDAQCEYGRRASNDRFVAGTCTVLAANDSGWADPMLSGMRPGRAIRLGVDHEDFGRVVLFRGFIDSIVPDYAPARADVVQLSCIDALGEVGRVKLIPFGGPANGNEFAHLRIHRTLDRAGWSASARDVAETGWTLIADVQGGQVADMLSRVGDSVGGALWGDTQGRIAFRARDWQIYDPSLPLDGTIGNVDDTDVCPSGYQRPFERAAISTQVVMGRTPDTSIIRNDITGQLLYGIETFARTDLLTYQDPYIADLADRTLETRSYETAPRVRQALIDARVGDEQIDLMSTVDVYKPSHYRCRLVEDRGLVFDDRYMATGVAHHLTANRWTMELNLDLAAPYEVVSVRWDTGRWDQADWANL